MVDRGPATPTASAAVPARSQRAEVLILVMSTVQRSAWYGHSEAILQTMLCSKDEDERREAVERILEIRG